MRLLVLLAVAALLAAPAAAGDRPSLAKLEAEIICPVCHTTLDQSDSPIALRMKGFIKQRIAAGDSESQIKSKLVAQFGEAVLASPPRKGFNLLAWWLPIAGIAAGAAALGFGAWRWSRGRESSGAGGEGPLEPELERRLDEELARFES